MNHLKTSRPNKLGSLLESSKLARFVEMITVFGAAVLIIILGLPFTGDNLFAKQLVLVAANAAMLILVWLSLRWRGQDARYLGLSFDFGGWKAIARGFAKSLAVLFLAMAGFIFG